MGRTKRKRTKIGKTRNASFDDDLSIINLKKWMVENNWWDPLHLQLRMFANTGRGVAARTNIKPNDTLIKVPLDLLITYETIERSNLLDSLEEDTYTMHELLSFFLVIEKHKGESSDWVHYVNSLPDPEPNLPWSNPLAKISALPEDLKITAYKLQGNFLDSFAKLKRSILPTYLCRCCKKPLLRVFEENLFRWAYVLVNTRAVYVDPQLYKSMNTFKLSNEPSMALCPFLDMFNHDHIAMTEVIIYKQQGRWYYELITLKGYQKYQQIFIPYGAHNNEKLLMEYGFLLPENRFDCVRFKFKEILDVSGLSLNQTGYKFIKKHNFDAGDIYINTTGCSFNLKAIIYVGVNGHSANFSSIVFSDGYTNDFIETLNAYCDTLLKYKLGYFEKDTENYTRDGDDDPTITSFLRYRVKYTKDLLRNLG